jgi:regulatory protein YycI of two-component signal transduction system YycFG
MKTYQSTTEGQWIELKGVQLTKEQRDLMRSRNETDREAQAQLSDEIKSQREGEVPTQKKNELKAFYDSVKPELKEGDNYELISIDLSEKEDKLVGILNCRINGEHKQVRF